VPADLFEDVVGRPRLQNVPQIPDTGIPSNGIVVDIGAHEADGQGTFPGIARWVDGSGGDYGLVTNWIPGIPSAINTVQFDLPSAYTVDLDASRTVRSVVVSLGDITLDLLGNAYAVSGVAQAGLTVGKDPGDNALFTVMGGTFRGFSGQLGEQAGADGHLIIRDGGNVEFEQACRAGVSGSGTITIENGGVLTCFQNLTIGFAGIGSMQIVDGGHVVSLNADVGSLVTSLGTVVVSGKGSTWDVPFYLSVNRGSLEVTDAGLIRSGISGLFPGVFLFDDGVIRGNGTIEADVINFGEVEPTDPANPLLIDGRYVQVG